MVKSEVTTISHKDTNGRDSSLNVSSVFQSNTSLSKLISDKRLCLPPHDSPAVENVRSIGAEEPGIVSKSTERGASNGCDFSWSSQNPTGSASSSDRMDDEYCSSSCSPGFFLDLQPSSHLCFRTLSMWQKCLWGGSLNIQCQT